MNLKFKLVLVNNKRIMLFHPLTQGPMHGTTFHCIPVGHQVQAPADPSTTWPWELRADEEEGLSASHQPASCSVFGETTSPRLCSGCHSRMPQPGWLTHSVYFSQFLRLGAHNEGTGKPGSWRCPASWLTDEHLLARPLRGRREEAAPRVSCKRCEWHP